MPRVREGYEGVYIEVPVEVAAAMRRLAATNDRGVGEEMVSAFRRHLATPPVVVIVEPPALKQEKVERGEQPRPRRGRKPRKP